LCQPTGVVNDDCINLLSWFSIGEMVVGSLFAYSFHSAVKCHSFEGFDCIFDNHSGINCFPRVIDCEVAPSTRDFPTITVDKGSFSLYTTFSVFSTFFDRVKYLYNGGRWQCKTLIGSSVISCIGKSKDPSIDDILKYLSNPDDSPCYASRRKRPRVEKKSFFDIKGLFPKRRDLEKFLTVKLGNEYSEIEGKYSHESEEVWTAMYVEKKVQHCFEHKELRGIPITAGELIVMSAYLSSLEGYLRVLQLKEKTDSEETTDSPRSARSRTQSVTTSSSPCDVVVPPVVESPDDQVVEVKFSYATNSLLGARVFESSTGKVVVCDSQYGFLIAGSLHKNGDMFKGGSSLQEWYWKETVYDASA